MATGVPKTQWQGHLDAPLSTEEVELTYPGKKPVREVLATRPASIHSLWGGDAVNRLYHGDNLPILAALCEDENVRGKVRLVYIDPPFATRSVFHSRAQQEAYTDLRAGGEYLEFLRQRLILLRELLADDGSIYVHLDDNMAAYAKVLMDEIFGKTHFRNFITRKKCNPKNYTRKTYGNVSDYILFYTKSDTYCWNRPVEQWTEEQALKEYEYVEPDGRRYKKVPVHAPGTRNGETGQPWRGKLPPPGKHWQFSPRILDEMDARGEIYWSPNGNPRRKIYLDKSNGIPIQDIWLEFKDAHNQNIEITGYPTEKNDELLKRIIRASSNPGDLVLDCFFGSGTTLVASSELNRTWIGIDNGLEAVSTTLQRFAHGLSPMGDFVGKRKNGKALQEDLSLFRITDFAFYASEPVNPELTPLLLQWQAWLSANE